jgi:hypothetical protein
MFDIVAVDFQQRDFAAAEAAGHVLDARLDSVNSIVTRNSILQLRRPRLPFEHRRHDFVVIHFVIIEADQCNHHQEHRVAHARRTTAHYQPFANDDQGNIAP